MEYRGFELPPLAASTDTLPARINAAQTSGSQLFAGIPAASKPHTSKRVSVRHLRAARKVLRDSIELYQRRRPVDTRVTNRTGLASFWLAVGSVASLLLSSATDGGAFGLVGLLAAIGGLVTGFVSLSEFRRNPDKFKGKGYPIAGITWGGTLILLFLIVLVVLLAFFSTI